MVNLSDDLRRKNRVLIDTWWNVNHIFLQTLGRRSSVLIDTWWNVNYSFLNSMSNMLEF